MRGGICFEANYIGLRTVFDYWWLEAVFDICWLLGWTLDTGRWILDA